MDFEKTFIIAELSANHNHDFDLAVRTIEAMAESGADAIKIQTYTPDSMTLNLNNPNHPYFGVLKEGLWKATKSSLTNLRDEKSLGYWGKRPVFGIRKCERANGGCLGSWRRRTW